MLLNRQSDMCCIGCLSTADTLLDDARSLNADVVLLDLTMPGLPPLNALGALAASGSPARVLVFSGYDDLETSDAVFAAGGWGLISKLADPMDVLVAIRRIARGETLFPG